VREVQTGVWHWEAPHPDWTPAAGEDGWGPEVSCYAIDTGERLLLLDPLAPPSAIDELAGTRETAIVLTCPWHVGEAAAWRSGSARRAYVPPPYPRPPDVGDPNPVQGHVLGRPPAAGR